MAFGVAQRMTVGTAQGSLIHVVFREKGSEVTRQLFPGIDKTFTTGHRVEEEFL